MNAAGSTGEAGPGRGVEALLEAKLEPPAVRPNWVRRDRLVEVLDRATSESALTLVAGPAGYGKTTLVAQWLSGLEDRRLAWVALDSADDAPARLWTHIVAALERAGCAFPAPAAQLVAASGTDLITGLLPTLVNAMAALAGRAGQAERIVLVLDDYHFVRVDTCHEQVNALIEHLPSSAAMVITTRADPGLRLGRLRATRQLAEIRADRLRFDTDATAALLATEHVDLSNGAVSELVHRTEGWPAAVYLAALSLIGRDDPEGFVHQVSGSDRFIGEYLVEEVLSCQPRPVREFILNVSILERFSASLCDFLLQTNGSARLLRDLERSNLFVVPLDAHGQWFRFHHLFAALARSELEAQADQRRLRMLHERASDWYASHGYLEEALQQAIATGSSAQAARLVEANWIRFVEAGRTTTADGWLRAWRTSDGSADPAAMVAAAWIALARGEEAELRGLLTDLAEAPDIGVLPDGTRSIESAVALLNGMTGYDGTDGLMAAARRATELEDDEHSPWYATATFELGHALYVVGDLEAAMQELAKAAYSASAYAVLRVFALGVMSMVAREQGNTAISRHAALEAMTVVDSTRCGTSPRPRLPSPPSAKTKQKPETFTVESPSSTKASTSAAQPPALTPGQPSTICSRWAACSRPPGTSSGPSSCSTKPAS